jgi:cytochrome c oxidase cbb3-type subunit 2
MAHDSRPLERIEKNAGLLGIVILVLVSFGGLAEITPLFVNAHTVAPAPGLQPYDALRLAGRDVYVREACYQCHSQMIRKLRFETQRYGQPTDASEVVYDRPFQWGSKRTGPDLARVGGKYSDAWHRLHLIAPRQLDYADVMARMRVLRRIGDPYTDADITAAYEAVRNKTELDALVAYLQGLGVTARQAP